MRVLYDAADYASPVLTGVDNVIVSRSGDIFVAEDGGNMELVMITPEGVITPFLQATGPQHGVAVDGLPTTSEICSITFSPNGRRLYFSSERGFGVGITYEVTGPFRA
jgi:secreted PhoX family phosphatase